MERAAEGRADADADQRLQAASFRYKAAEIRAEIERLDS